MKKSIIVSFILCFSLLKTYTQVLSGYGIVASYNAFQYSQEKSPLLFDPIANMGVGLYGDWLKNKNFKLRTQVSYIQRATNIAYLPPYGTNINPTTGLVNGDVMEYQQLNSNLAIDLDFKANILVKKIKPFILIGVRQLYCLSTQLNKTQTWSNDFTYVYF
ncbi:MAG: hypothetical protein IT235_01775, partial [Bacteroidia bacterium]|nr:hypothetical protein [Bacteroidia bacterium]